MTTTTIIRMSLGALALLAGSAGAVITPASGYAVRTIPTPTTVAGGIARSGPTLLVGQGASFTAGAQDIIRFTEGGPATTIATGFNSLGGFFLDADGTLWTVDNCYTGDGCGSPTHGDTLYAIPDALTRSTPIAATAAAVLPSGTLPFAQDVIITSAGILMVADAAGPGAGRIVRVDGATVTNVITGLDYGGGLANDLDGDLYVANLDAGFNGTLQRHFFDGTFISVLASGLAGSYDVVVDADGLAIVSGAFGGPLVAIGSGGGVTTRATGFGFSTEMFADRPRNEVLVLDFAATEIVAICRDQDSDGVCDADDNCPRDANAGQGDGDGDGIGDACDVCASGTGMIGASLKAVQVAPLGSRSLKIKGTLGFPGALPIAPLDVDGQGLRIQLVDLGQAGLVAFDYAIPAGAAGGSFHCGAVDGWKTSAAQTTQSYKNVTQGILPTCVVGTSEGIASAKVIDRTSLAQGAKVLVKGKRGSYTALVGPVQMTVILGGAAEGAAGQCGHVTFAPGECAYRASGLFCSAP